MAIQEPAFTVSEQVIQVRDRWQMTLPADIRRRIGLRKGDVFTVVQVGDTVVLTRKKLVVPELADKVAQIIAEQGVTLDDLPGELETQRRRYREEKYGGQAQSFPRLQH